MANSGDYAGGMQPQKTSDKSPQQKTTDARPDMRRKQDLDGITTMTGTVTFDSTGVSINVTINPFDAQATGIQAAAATGNTVPANASTVSTSRRTNLANRTDVVTANDLPVATTGQPYTVQIRYDSGGPCTKQGTVAGDSVVIGDTVDVTLS